MSGVKKQVLSNAIDILLNQGNLPEKLDGKKLYGEALDIAHLFLYNITY